VTWLSRLAYANGNLGKSGLGSLLEVYGLFYLTDVLRIPPATAGGVLLLSLVWDAFNDPLIGALADRAKTTLRTVRVYFTIGAPLAAISFAAIFWGVELPASMRAPFALAMLLVFRTAYTLVDLPHNSLLAFLSKDPRDRTTLASLRIFFSGAGKFLATAVTAWLLSDGAGRHEETVFQTAAFVMALVFLVSLGICFAAVRNVRLSGAGAIAPAFDPSAAFRLALQDRGLAKLFALTALNSATIPMIGATFVYASKYGLGDPSLGAHAVVLLAAAQSVSVIGWAMLANRSGDKAGVAQLAYWLLLTGVTIALFFAADEAGALFVAAALCGAGMGGVFALNWSLLPDALDKASQHAPGREMGVFGAYTLTNSICHGLSQAGFGLVLWAWGYAPEAEAANLQINEIIATLLAAPAVASLVALYQLRR